MQPIKNIIAHPDLTGKFLNKTIVEPVPEMPSAKQIINCRNVYNEGMDICGRIIQTDISAPMEVEVWGVQNNTIY